MNKKRPWMARFKKLNLIDTVKSRVKRIKSRFNRLNLFLLLRQKNIFLSPPGFVTFSHKFEANVKTFQNSKNIQILIR